MKYLALTAAMSSLLVLSACGDAPSNPEGQKAQADSSTQKQAERITAKIATDLSKMDTPDIIDFVDAEAKSMTALLKTVTDGPSAEAAVDDLRAIIPRLNASLKSLENMDVENMTLNIGNMRKMMKVGQSQIGLVNEVVRISEIPEARSILEKEFDKIEITNR